MRRGVLAVCCNVQLEAPRGAFSGYFSGRPSFSSASPRLRRQRASLLPVVGFSVAGPRSRSLRQFSLLSFFLAAARFKIQWSDVLYGKNHSGQARLRAP